MNKEFREYIRMIIAEVLAENPRVPSQLVSPDDGEKKKEKADDSEKDEEDELDEFSGVGAIAGYTLPLGMAPNFPIAGSTKRKTGKRKKPSWA